MEFELHPDLKRDGHVLGSFPLSLLLLINDRRYPWFVLVPQRAGIRELFELTDSDYSQFCHESKVFGQAILSSFDGQKLNVAALGNMTPQLHIHHIVRYESDHAWPKPIWGHGPMEPYSTEEIKALMSKLSLGKPEDLSLLS